MLNGFFPIVVPPHPPTQFRSSLFSLTASAFTTVVRLQPHLSLPVVFVHNTHKCPFFFSISTEVKNVHSVCTVLTVLGSQGHVSVASWGVIRKLKQRTLQLCGRKPV